MVLSAAMPSNSHCFLAIRLDNLLKATSAEKAELRRKYNNGLARILLRQFESDLQNDASQCCSWTLANHLLNSIDAEFTDRDLKMRLLNVLQGKLKADYESHFESLVIKHPVLSLTTKKQSQYYSYRDLVATLVKYRHAMINTMQFIADNQREVGDAVQSDFLDTYAKMVHLDLVMERYE